MNPHPVQNAIPVAMLMRAHVARFIQQVAFEKHKPNQRRTSPLSETRPFDNSSGAEGRMRSAP